MENFQTYLQPTLVILVPVLAVIGKMIKTSEKINDKLIPLLLGLIGVGLGFLFEVNNFNEFSFRMVTEVLYFSVTQGFIAAGIAVYGNQMYKQMHK